MTESSSMAGSTTDSSAMADASSATETTDDSGACYTPGTTSHGTAEKDTTKESSKDSSKSAASSAPAEAAATGILSNFSAQTLDGKKADASIFANSKVTMVNVWATYCGPCLNEMPDLAAINQKYADQGFQIVGIVSDAFSADGVNYTDKELATAKELVKETGASYTHLLPSQDLYNALLMNVQYVPTTIFVDSKGNQIGDAVVGSHSAKDWTAMIESLLKQSSGS